MKYYSPPEYLSRMARIEVDRQGYWALGIMGTDIHVRLRKEQNVEPGTFPGEGANARLKRRGFKVDASDTRWHPSGWRPVKTDAWVIPCYPED